jgi:hypothetical protein
MTAAGVPCGHESACQVTGFKGFGEYAGDASWFAAAYMTALPADVVVLHQVRNPLAVAKSWYRIGLFASNPLRTVCYGNTSARQLARLARAPGSTLRRWRYVRDQRRIVRKATDVFDYRGEADRCLRYWAEWNRLVETSVTRRPLYRFKLEDLGPEVWNAISQFIDVDLGPFREQSDTPSPANLKPRYPSRPFPATTIPDDVRSLAEKYGYDVNAQEDAAEEGAGLRTQASTDTRVRS